MRARRTTLAAASAFASALVAFSSTLAGCVVPPEPSAASDTSPSPSPLITTGVVEWVYDGDTLRVDDQRIRLIGIDAPDVLDCGHDEATALLTSLVLDKTVTVTAVEGHDEHDQFGRPLRYVDVDGTDVAVALLDAGLAVAGYDGTTGKQWHPRQDTYHAADDAAPQFACP